MMGLNTKVVQLAYFLAACWLVCGDVYMHNPRGSNNRLNERSANRNNANRMFDSQNNNRGGYNAGDTDDRNGFQTESQIYYMKYFQSGLDAGQDSLLQIEWTNQHGCGGREGTDSHKLNCNVVLQYIMPETFTTQDVAGRVYDGLRNGDNTNTQDYGQPPNENENEASFTSRRNGKVMADRGLHEVFENYDDCASRDRNRGLFTADQRLRGDSAIYTRQNPNGNRRGYECPEERDYYPYWHPTPWRDIAILTDNVSLCNYYQSESFNVKPKQYCRQRYTTNNPRHWSKYNNQQDCENPPDNNVAPGEWYTEYSYVDIATGVTERNCETLNSTLSSRGYRTIWYFAKFGDASEQCLILPPAPECIQAPWSRVNHLGNGREGVPLNYTWRMPYFRSNAQKLTAVRIRYNISTDDYHPWQTNASHNANPIRNRRSPVEQNPNVDIGLTNNKPLRLAINTAQFGRTFQDRSHVIHLRPRSMLRSEDRGCLLHNLNVRGKRGNIVQTYPAVEYDFIPNRLEISAEDCVHVQWTGSNTHNNGAAGGDGQTGDAGEGRGGTDKHNMIEVPEPNSNYPCLNDKPCGPGSNRLFRDASIAYAYNGQTGMTPANLELTMLSGGYYQCFEPTTNCMSSVSGNNTRMNQLLDNLSPSFEGFVLKFSQGTYYYICSRNNNFTNRSQKGMLVVKA